MAGEGMSNKRTPLDTLCTCGHRFGAHSAFSADETLNQPCLYGNCECTRFQSRDAAMIAQEAEVQRLTIEWRKKRGAKR